MNLFDARAAYSRALDVAMQWHRLARKTDNLRHLATALICSRIALMSALMSAFKGHGRIFPSPAHLSGGAFG
jgi:hypothetical protein